MRVVGKEEGELAWLEREPSFRFAVEKFDVALFVVAQTIFQTTLFHISASIMRRNFITQAETFGD